MKIENIAYEKLYQVLLDNFRDNELDANEWNASGMELKRHSPQLWDIKRRETNKTGDADIPVVNKILKGVSRDTRIFYRILKDFNSPKAVDGCLEISDKLLIVAFEYLNCVIPRELEQEILFSRGKRVYVLFQKFLENYFPEYLERNPDLKIVDFENLIVLKSSGKVNGQDRKTYNDDGDTHYRKQNEIGYDIEKLINDFYRFISHGEKLDRAWDLLSATFKKRYNDNYEAFKIGYAHTESIYDIHVWNIKFDGDLATCNVYYLDAIKTYTSYAVSNLDKLKIADIDIFASKVQLLIEKSKDTSLQGFDSIEIQKLFDPAASEYIWYKCGMDAQIIQELLPDERHVTIPRLFRIGSVKIDEKWLIKSIVPITSRLIR